MSKLGFLPSNRNFEHASKTVQELKQSDGLPLIVKMNECPDMLQALTSGLQEVNATSVTKALARALAIGILAERERLGELKKLKSEGSLFVYPD